MSHRTTEVPAFEQLNHRCRPSPLDVMMANTIVLITGASGFLGRRLVRQAAASNRVVAVTHRGSSTATEPGPVSVDVANESSFARLVHGVAPSAIIHTAAVNPGQGDEQTMWRVNVDGSRNVARAAADVGARLISVSTDVVHDGTCAPYGDDVPPSPINVYGQTKAAAEAEIRSIKPDAAIVRSSLIYGLDEMDRGTAGFVDRIARGERLSLFSDVLRNPVWVETLAEALLRLVELEFRGFLNVGGTQVLSREAFGRKMLEYWEVSEHGLVESVRAADVSSSTPRDLRLDLTRARSLLDMELPGVDEVLDTLPPRAVDGENQD